MQYEDLINMVDEESFVSFRSLYTHQMKSQSNCEDAFQIALRHFVKMNGYTPYKSLEEYLFTLFEKHDGIHLLNKNIKQ